MNTDNNMNERYSFRIEGGETPQAPQYSQPNPPAQQYTQPAQPYPYYAQPAQPQMHDDRSIKKMIRRAIALSVALALLMGAGVGILLQHFVFGPKDRDAAAEEQPAIVEQQNEEKEPDRTTPDEPQTSQKPDTVTDSRPGTSVQNHQNTGNLLFTENSNREELSISDVVTQVENSVVAITVEVEGTAYYFNQPYSYTNEAKGSGVIVSADGYIVTNNHVVADATKVYVTLANGENYDAEVIGADELTDLGLIKIDASGLTAAQLGSSEDLRKGDTAIIIGNPLGYLDGSVSTGIISAMGRTLEFSDGTVLHNLIQTDAAVNPGNSGGGLFDARGSLVGIVCAKTASAEVEGLGFAIPVTTVRTVIQDLKDYGFVKGRPALGVNAMEVTNAYTAMYNHLPRLGVYVTGFISNEAAEGSELEIGDCIVSIDGVEVTTVAEILAALYPYHVGDSIEVVVVRNNEMVTVSTTLVEQDSNY